MSAKGQLDGTWSPARINLKYNNVWHEENTTWVKLNGVWHSLVPDEVIILYASSSYPADAKLCDGTQGTPDLLGNYLGACSSGSWRSFTYHGQYDVGSLHVHPYYASVSDATHPYGEGPGVGFDHDYNTDETAHNHSLENMQFHTDGGEVTYPLTCGVAPTMGASYIDDNAIILKKTAAIISGFASFLYQALYLQSNGGVTSGATTHRHFVTWTSTTVHSVSSVNYYIYHGRSGLWHRQHLHTDSGTIYTGYASNVFKTPSDTVYGNKRTGGRMFFDELPSGSILPFIGEDARIPQGWQRLNWNECSVPSNGEVNLSFFHLHGGNTGTTSGYIEQGSAYPYLSGSTGRIIPSHEHTVTVHNIGTQSPTVVFTLLPFIEKT